MNSQMKNVNEQKKKDFYSCSVCKDTSWLIDFNGKATRCKCFEIDKVREQWKYSGLKADDLDKTFKTYEPWNEITRIMKSTTTNYALRYNNIKNSKQNSILFCGNPGSGKTHLSIALANKFIKDGHKVVYMPYRDSITKIKQNMIDADYYKNIVSKYQQADILLVDDLFKGKINESDINIMFEIVNHRYINKLAMIVSTEYLVEEMLRFDEAIGSRIYEMAKDFTVEVVGPNNNYRLRGK